MSFPSRYFPDSFFPRRFFPAIGAESVVVPVGTRTGDSVIIHHGRRPALPSLQLPPQDLPLLPQPRRQPQEFFERGVTRLTLFITSRSTLRVREQLRERILHFSDFAYEELQISETCATSIAMFSTFTPPQVEIHHQMVETMPFREANTYRIARLPLLRLPSILYEYQHERILLYTHGHEFPHAYEHETLSTVIHSASHIREHWDIPDTALMEAIALTVAYMLEEDR